MGTTFSAVAKVNASGVPEILPNRDGENVTPSVVFFGDDGNALVGTMAARSAVMAPQRVCQFVKRSMGDPDWRFRPPAKRNVSWRAEEISALILRRLAEDAGAALGSTVRDAVITVPAYFDDGARQATIDAGRIAGLNVRRVLNEPTAAALAYGLSADTSEASIVVVYDLGGGTFDVTAMQLQDGQFRVLATHGDRNLGGYDFDNALMELIDEHLREQHQVSFREDSPFPAQQLRERTELAKRTLTSAQQTRVTLSGSDRTATVDVTRSEFEEATAPLLSRTRDILEIVLADAGLTWGQVSRILLAGGSTRMPMVRAMIESASGCQVDASQNPHEVVALGAAVQAHLIDVDDAGRGGMMQRAFSGNQPQLPALLPNGSNPTVRDVTSHGLGVVVRDTEGRRTSAEILADEWPQKNSVIIPANTPIPATSSGMYYTVEDYQSSIRWQVTQGDDHDLAYVRIVGEASVPVPPGYPKHSAFRCTYAYDANQTIHAEVVDMRTDKLAAKFRVDNVANLSADEVQKASARVRRVDIS
ncbi:molecular chaperone DnaK [Tenggerimyces flavus]|nr:molecular chaperone DnaK [Tenggerimyces flavus]